MKIIVFCFIFILSSCGVSNKSEQHDQLQDRGIHYLNLEYWDQAIDIFQNLIKNVNSKENQYYLALAYAGCSEYELNDFYFKFKGAIDSLKDTPTENIVDDFHQISKKFPVLNQKQLNCLDKAIQYFPLEENQIPEYSSYKYNFDWAAIRLYRLIYQIKETYAYFDLKITQEKGKNITVSELLKQKRNSIENILEDSFMFYVYMNNSYDKLNKESNKLKEAIIELLQKHQIDIYVKTQALNTNDFLKDLLEQNPELVNFFALNLAEALKIAKKELIEDLKSFINEKENQEIIKDFLTKNPEEMQKYLLLNELLKENTSTGYINDIMNTSVYTINEILNESKNIDPIDLIPENI